MSDLTPGTDIQKELPQECTFETALADLIDDSLHDLWSNERIHVKHISVDVVDDMISIFAQWTDESDENPIVKWVKRGASLDSLHRSCQKQAREGNPLYLKPYFGMFGYGEPVVSMPLGRAKTRDSKKVYTLNLDRDALLRGSNWKVEISEPKLGLDISQLQCKLKDIYFPDIQYDEDSKSGHTIIPVKFEVNGVDLAEIDGGEIAISNMHYCNGPDFVSQLLSSCKQDNTSKSPELLPSKCPLSHKMGTINFGFKDADGITVGVDGRSCIILKDGTAYTHSDVENKFFQLSTKFYNLVCTMMGDVMAWKVMYAHLRKEIGTLEVSSGPVKASDAAQIAKDYMDEYIRRNTKNPSVFGTLIAGWEQKAGFELFDVSITDKGTKTVMDNHDACSIGYGSVYTGVVAKVLSKKGLDIREDIAAEIVLKTLLLATYASGTCGGVIKVYHIGKGKYEDKYLMTALEHQHFLYGRVMDETCTLFLLYSKKVGQVFGNKLKDLWPEPKGKLVTAHHIADFVDYYFHRLCFLSAQDVSSAYKYVEEHKCPPIDPRFHSKFMTLKISGGNFSGVYVYVARSSRDLLQYLHEGII